MVFQRFDHVLCSLPADALAAVLVASPDWGPAEGSKQALIEELQAIVYATVWTVNIAYPTSQLRHPGFGMLVPSSAKLRLLGITFDSYGRSASHCSLTSG